MNNYIKLLVTFLLVASACNPKSRKSEDTLVSYEQNCQTTYADSTDVNYLWACFLNNGTTDSLKTVYSNNSIKVVESGEVISGLQNISDDYRKNDFSIDTVYSIKRIAANATKTYDYEIGAFTTENEALFKHLLIWNNQYPQKRVFEFIAESTKAIPVDPGIHAQREKWIALCNLHNATQLVTELYHANALYFNHKPVIVGWDAIAKDYQYMNDKNYSLRLEPIKLEMVAENLAYEIGQCIGTYNGKYLLVWKKDGKGDWKILVDSNI